MKYINAIYNSKKVSVFPTDPIMNTPFVFRCPCNSKDEYNGILKEISVEITEVPVEERQIPVDINMENGIYPFHKNIELWKKLSEAKVFEGGWMFGLDYLVKIEEFPIELKEILSPDTIEYTIKSRFAEIFSQHNSEIDRNIDTIMFLSKLGKLEEKILEIMNKDENISKIIDMAMGQYTISKDIIDIFKNNKEILNTFIIGKNFWKIGKGAKDIAIKYIFLSDLIDESINRLSYIGDTLLYRFITGCYNYNDINELNSIIDILKDNGYNMNNTNIVGQRILHTLVDSYRHTERKGRTIHEQVIKLLMLKGTTIKMDGDPFDIKDVVTKLNFSNIMK